MTTFESTAWELIAAAASGRVEARERFARTYQAVVRAYLAKRWGGGPLASCVDDAMQDVFIACFKDGGALDGVDRDAPGGFRAYLRGVVRNTARQFERREAQLRRRQDPGTFLPDQRPLPQTSPSLAFDRKQTRAILREAAEALERRAEGLSESAVQRVIILRLRFRDDMPIREIAVRLGRDPAWVHHQYAKARAEFRRVLAEILARRLPAPPADIEAHCVSLMKLFE